MGISLVNQELSPNEQPVLYVNMVVEGGVAEANGVKAGDVVTAVNGDHNAVAMHNSPALFGAYLGEQPRPITLTFVAPTPTSEGGGSYGDGSYDGEDDTTNAGGSGDGSGSGAAASDDTVSSEAPAPAPAPSSETSPEVYKIAFAISDTHVSALADTLDSQIIATIASATNGASKEHMVLLFTDGSEGVDIRVAILSDPASASTVAAAIASPKYATTTAAALAGIGLQLTGGITALPMPGVSGKANFAELFGVDSPLHSDLGGPGDVDISYFQPPDSIPDAASNTLLLRAQAQTYMHSQTGAAPGTNQVRAGDEQDSRGVVSPRVQQALVGVGTFAVVLAAIAVVAIRRRKFATDEQPLHLWQQSEVETTVGATPNPASMPCAEAISAMETAL
jgi:hypothetical protein